MTLANVIVNYRMRPLASSSDGPADERWRRTAIEEMRREERIDDPAPSTADIAKMFPMQLAATTLSIAKFWGLEINRDTPEADAIEELLKPRYRYWEDDIEHPSYFTISGESAS